MFGWVRLTHPFPSVLDGVVVTAFALMAGGDGSVSLRAGAAMTLLQLGIGTTNDVVDAPFDAGRKAGKPIPAGIVGRRAAAVLAGLCFTSGVVAAASIGPELVALSLLVVAIGLVYDLRLKGTPWSWLPFACGIPILPLYGWLAGAATLEPAFAVLLPAAVASGAALAIGNSVVDIDRDGEAGRTSVARSLGERPALRVEGALFLAAAVAATASLAAWRPGPLVLLVAIAGAVPVIATGLAAWRPAAREAAWRVEAIGVAVLGAAWTWAVLV